MFGNENVITDNAYRVGAKILQNMNFRRLSIWTIKIYEMFGFLNYHNVAYLF
jgi:hypothetical protein